MADLNVRTGAQSAQGLRSNNEDRFVVDDKHHLYRVADGMGGQDAGEKASGLAAEIIPRVVGEGLAAHEDAGHAVARALQEANQAIIHASQHQVPGRRMGTTASITMRTIHCEISKRKIQVLKSSSRMLCCAPSGCFPCHHNDRCARLYCTQSLASESSVGM